MIIEKRRSRNKNVIFHIISEISGMAYGWHFESNFILHHDKFIKASHRLI